MSTVLTGASADLGKDMQRGILTGLGEFDIGLGEPLHLSRTEHQASHRVWPTLLEGGEFLPFRWSDIKALTKSETSP